MAGLPCVADQVNTVEEQTRAGWVWTVGERTEARNDWILSAGDGTHVARWWLVDSGRWFHGFGSAFTLARSTIHEPPSIIVLQSDFNDERQDSQAIQR